MFRGIKKEDLCVIAKEIGEKTNDEMQVVDLKNLILNSDCYKKYSEFVEQFTISVIPDSKLKEENEAQIELEKIN